MAKIETGGNNLVAEMVQGMLSGSQQPLARLITLVERDSPEVPEIMKHICHRVGKAYRVGITGPPGAGKSTVVDRLTAELRKKGLTVGIVAADPSSPFSGGAVLGDRIRMQQHYLDDGVFIRSMATRGSSGGLPTTVRGVIKLLDASGRDFILVETVGVGQTELDIMEAVDTVVVVLVPEAGDTIQTMKAGLLEIADIFAVNKADRPGADNLASELKIMLEMYPQTPWWTVPVLTTEACNNVGIVQLLEAIEKHRLALLEGDRLGAKRREQRRREFIETVEQRVTGRLVELIAQDQRLASYVERVEKGEMDSCTASEEILVSESIVKNWFGEMVRGDRS